jgi:hypothetical protein
MILLNLIIRKTQLWEIAIVVLYSKFTKRITLFALINMTFVLRISEDQSILGSLCICTEDLIAQMYTRPILPAT